MTTVLIGIIFLAFISMGLPDTLLGSAWPAMFADMNVPVSYAGFISLLISGGTVISSLFSNRLVKKLGSGMVTAVCTLLTAVALFGFSISTSFWQLCAWAVPYGLGAGSIDAVLNNYIAVKYKSRHMSWLHFCWGIGATAGPYIMGTLLTRGAMWTSGYRVIAIVQASVTLCLFLSMPLWKKNPLPESAEAKGGKAITNLEAIRLKGAKNILVAFFCYCALESTAGMWASSYMVIERGLSAETAAKWASVFYLGITVGRFLCGFVSDRVGDKNMIRLGQGLILAGLISLVVFKGNGMCLAGLLLVGFGCAPVFPCLLHATPKNFGADKSQVLMGLQMACAYIGSTAMPPVMGLIAEHINIALYPVFLLCFIVVMIVLIEGFNRQSSGKALENQTEA